MNDQGASIPPTVAPVWADKPATREEHLQRVLACLKDDPRAAVRDIGRRTQISSGTVSRLIREIRERHDFLIVERTCDHHSDPHAVPAPRLPESHPPTVTAHDGVSPSPQPSRTREPSIHRDGSRPATAASGGVP